MTTVNLEKILEYFKIQESLWFFSTLIDYNKTSKNKTDHWIS